MEKSIGSSIGFAITVAVMQSDGKISHSSSISSPLRAEGLSTYSPSIRHKSTEDGELYIAGQCLVPVVNNPSNMHRSNSGSYGILSWPASAADKAWAEALPPPPSGLHKQVSFSDFDDYRIRVGTLMDRYLHRRMSVHQDRARRLSVADPDGCGYLRGEGLVQALRHVPSLYFQEDFSLTRPETFSQVVRGDTPEERNATLETLNNALDIVETELLNEIAARSDSFFEAAESLQELRRSMGDTLFQIQRLQIHAHNIDNGMCSRAEHIHNLHTKRRHLEMTLDVLKMVETVTNAQEAVNLLLMARDYPSALDLIDDLKQQYDDPSPSGILAQGAERLKCLRHIPDALDASSVSLRACLIGELLELLDWDEGESVLRSVAAKALGEEGRMGMTMTPATNEQWMAKKHQLSHILMGLSRTGTLTGTFTEVIPHAVSRLNGCLRNLIEILIPNFVPLNEVDSPCSQTDQMPCIAHDKFLAVLSASHSVASQCMRHYRRWGELMLEATDEAGIVHHRASVDKGRMDLCQALLDANGCHWMKLYQSREHVHQLLTLDQLQQLIKMNESNEALGSSNRSGQKVGTTLQSLCKAAMESMQRRNVSGLQAALEQESWKLATVDPFIQQTLFQNFCPDVTLDNPDEKLQMVKLDEKVYRVAHAVLVLALMICEAIGHNRQFPEFVMETGRHLIELITIFNTRSCQLVLGAQAMQVSGLKSITAKHLALCSQSILFLRDLHPYLCTALLDSCPQVKRTILQPELDRIKQDLETHLNGIHSKLVSIMKERLQIGIRQLRDEMTITEESDATSPSQASQQIAKQLRILTQVLIPILHQHQITDICTNVAEIFGEELAGAFQEIIEEYKLLSQIPKEMDASHPHPLGEGKEMPVDASTTDPSRRIDIQRNQLLTDCRFMMETIIKLPVGDRSEELVSPLRKIEEMLNTIEG